MKNYKDFIVNLNIAKDNAIKSGIDAIDAYNGKNALEPEECKDDFARMLYELHEEGKENLYEFEKAMESIKETLDDYATESESHPHSIEWLFYDNVPF